MNVCLFVHILFVVDSEEEKEEDDDEEDEGAEGEKKAKSTAEKPSEEQEVVCKESYVKRIFSFFNVLNIDVNSKAVQIR